MSVTKMMAPWLKKLVDDALFEFAWKGTTEKIIQPGIVLKVVPKDPPHESGSFYEINIPKELNDKIEGRVFLEIKKSRPE